jgi:hypothetical protein
MLGLGSDFALIGGVMSGLGNKGYKKVLLLLLDRCDRVTMWEDVVWLDGHGNTHPAREYVRKLQLMCDGIREYMKGENGK